MYNAYIIYFARQRSRGGPSVGVLGKLAVQLHDLVQLPNDPLHGHDLLGRAAERGF